jgi:hypothetical protein
VTIGGGVAGLEDAAIDAAAQVFDESTQQSAVGGTDLVIRAKLDSDGPHGAFPYTKASIDKPCVAGVELVDHTAELCPVGLGQPQDDYRAWGQGGVNGPPWRRGTAALSRNGRQIFDIDDFLLFRLSLSTSSQAS